MKIHELKILSEHFENIILGNKTAELRLNDRNYQVGDLIYFKEILMNGKAYINEAFKTTNSIMMLYITQVFSSTTYLQPGHVMLSFKLLQLDPSSGFLVKNSSTILEAQQLNRINHKLINEWLSKNNFGSTYI